MSNVRITKKSFDNLINRHIGAGRIFIHTADKMVTSFDFWLGRDGNFYTDPDFRTHPNNRLLAAALAEDAQELHRQEQERDK